MSISRLLAVLPFIFLSLSLLCLSAVPGLFIFKTVQGWGAEQGPNLQMMFSAIGIPLGYYGAGLSLMLVVAPLFNFLLNCRNLKAYRGRAASFGLVRWYAHAAIHFTVRYTFLELVTPSEFLLIYFRLMGMKMGRNVYLNSTAISDAPMIELGDEVTIGGSANLMAHYAQGGYVVLAPVKISRGATIGLRATVMGGVEVGERAKVLANSFVLPNTKIPAGETWAGIPAVRIESPYAKQKSAS